MYDTAKLDDASHDVPRSKSNSRNKLKYKHSPLSNILLEAEGAILDVSSRIGPSPTRQMLNSHGPLKNPPTRNTTASTSPPSPRARQPLRNPQTTTRLPLSAREASHGRDQEARRRGGPQEHAGQAPQHDLGLPLHLQLRVVRRVVHRPGPDAGLRRGRRVRGGLPGRREVCASDADDGLPGGLALALR